MDSTLRGEFEALRAQCNVMVDVLDKLLGECLHEDVKDITAMGSEHQIFLCADCGAQLFRDWPKEEK